MSRTRQPIPRSTDVVAPDSYRAAVREIARKVRASHGIATAFDPDVCRVDVTHCDHHGAGAACCYCGETPPDDPEGDR